MDLVGFPINRHLAAVPQRLPTATSHRLATLLSWGALLRIVTGDHDDTYPDTQVARTLSRRPYMPNAKQGDLPFLTFLKIEKIRRGSFCLFVVRLESS